MEQSKVTDFERRSVMKEENMYTPLVDESEWLQKYPDVDREYVWSYPLIHENNIFSPQSIFEISDIPMASYDTVVYVHVPACLFRCPMCPFYVELINNRTELDGYGDTIIKELMMYEKSPIISKLQVKSIYFGGGTASLLPAKDIGKIISKIRKVFSIKEEIEITVEGHPAVVDYNYLSEIRQYGVNRVSFGIQSFNDATLKSLGLRQTKEANISAIQNSKKVGFYTVATDMLYRTPNQTIDDLENQLKTFYNFGVNSISAYSLELSVRQGSLSKDQPNEEIDKEMFYYINNFFNEKGWDHTAQPDYAQRSHVQKEILVTWKAPQGQTIGLGAGACSSFNGVNYYNVHNMSEYHRVVNEGCLPVLTGQKYTIEDAMSRYAVLGARCFFLSYSEFKKVFGMEFEQAFSPVVDLLEFQGLVRRTIDGVEVTKKGKYYVDNISKSFYSIANRCHLQPWGEKMNGAVAEKYLKISTL